MQVLKSRIRADDSEFKTRLESYRALEAELSDKLATVAGGGSPRSVERHRARGKLLPRERLEALTNEVIAERFAGTLDRRRQRALGLRRNALLEDAAESTRR